MKQKSLNWIIVQSNVRINRNAVFPRCIIKNSKNKINHSLGREIRLLHRFDRAYDLIHTTESFSVFKQENLCRLSSATVPIFTWRIDVIRTRDLTIWRISSPESQRAIWKTPLYLLDKIDDVVMFLLCCKGESGWENLMFHFLMIFQYMSINRIEAECWLILL